MQYNFSNILLISHVKYFYNRLRFKFVIDKSCGGTFSGHSVVVFVQVYHCSITFINTVNSSVLRYHIHKYTHSLRPD